MNVHNIFMRYKNSNKLVINSVIGRLVENIKADISKCRTHLNSIQIEEKINSMDKFLLNNGNKIIETAEEAIQRVNQIDYLGIIKRSMKKNEICLGKVDESNIRVSNCIEIGHLKDISYNLIEEDIYNYLKRVNRKSPDLDLDMFIEDYIKCACLGSDSRCYIKILLSIPYDTIKIWKRYILNKKQIESSKYIESINKSINYEMREI